MDVPPFLATPRHFHVISTSLTAEVCAFAFPRAVRDQGLDGLSSDCPHVVAERLNRRRPECGVIQGTVAADVPSHAQAPPILGHRLRAYTGAGERSLRVLARILGVPSSFRVRLMPVRWRPWHMDVPSFF
jgi:hypothetical protein